MSPCRLFRMALRGDPRPMTLDAQTCLLAPKLALVLLDIAHVASFIANKHYAAMWGLHPKHVISLGQSVGTLGKAGWSLDWVSAIDSNGRTIWIVDAHRDNGKRYVVHAEEKLTAFLELEAAICACGESCLKRRRDVPNP